MLLQLAVIGLVIGSNNFAAALALGALGQRHRRKRVTATFGVFEFTIPLIGVALGRNLSDWLARYAGVVSAALLIGLGVWAVIAASRQRGRDERLGQLATSARGLVLLAVGLSIDNLLIGFSLGLRGLGPLAVATTIALFSMAFTWLGMTLGGASRRHWEKPAEIIAGLLLVAIGLVSALAD